MMKDILLALGFTPDFFALMKRLAYMWLVMAFGILILGLVVLVIIFVEVNYF